MMRQFLRVAGFLILALFVVLPVSAQVGIEPPCSTPLPLAIGQDVFTRPGVFIRNEPTRNSARVAYYAESRTLRITGGPVCADGYNWWQIDGPDNPGWVAEGRPDFLLIFPSENTLVETADCAAPLYALSDGDALRLIVNARVRRAPGFYMPVMREVSRNTPMNVRGAPACVLGTIWYPVWVPANEIFVEGWVAEQDDDGTVLVEPVVPQTGADLCAPPYRRLEPGVQAEVSYPGTQPKNLRTAPGVNAPIVTELLDGVRVEIIGGPVCADNYNWWQIRVVTRPDVSGWMAEGGTGAGGYWLAPLLTGG